MGAWRALPPPRGCTAGCQHHGASLTEGPRANPNDCRDRSGCVFVAGFLTGLLSLHMFWFGFGFFFCWFVCLVFFPAEFINNCFSFFPFFW